MKITKELQALLDQWYAKTGRPYLTAQGLGPGVRHAKAMNEFLANSILYDPYLTTNQNVVKILGQDVCDLRRKIEAEIPSSIKFRNK